MLLATRWPPAHTCAAPSLIPAAVVATRWSNNHTTADTTTNTTIAKIQLAAWPPFTAIYQTALHVNDLVTAILLLGMYAIHRHRALLALGCGYLFTGLLVIIHMLTFPGLFSAGGWLAAIFGS